MNKRLLSFMFTILLAGFLITRVNARGGVFLIEPSQEVTENIELKIPDGIAGNVSVSNGSIDFYVTSPSGTILFCYNNIAFETFEFTAEENGIYVMHLVNRNQENVTVSLNYGVNFVVVLQENIDMTFSMDTSVTTATITPVSPAPFDWVEILKDILYLISGLNGLRYLIGAIGRYLEKHKWKKKYREPRTPSEIKPF